MEGRKELYICSSRLGLNRWYIIHQVKAVHDKMSDPSDVHLWAETSLKVVVDMEMLHCASTISKQCSMFVPHSLQRRSKIILHRWTAPCMQRRHVALAVTILPSTKAVASKKDATAQHMHIRRHLSHEVSPLPEYKANHRTRPTGITSSGMPGSAHGAIAALPEEVVRKIVQQLRCKDACSLTMASKALYSWGQSLSKIEAYSLDFKKHTLASLLRFLAERMPMGGLKVCTLLLFCQSKGCTSLIGPCCP